MAVIIIFGTGW